MSSSSSLPLIGKQFHSEEKSVSSKSSRQSKSSSRSDKSNSSSLPSIAVHQQHRIPAPLKSLLGNVPDVNKPLSKYRRKLNRLLGGYSICLQFVDADVQIKHNHEIKSTIDCVHCIWDWKRDYLHWKGALGDLWDDVSTAIAKYEKIRGEDISYSRTTSQDSEVPPQRQSFQTAIS